MGVNIIFADVDGCLVRENKEKPAVLTDNSENITPLAEVASFLDMHPDVQMSTATFRSMASGLPIMELAGIRDYSFFENGTVIYNPRTSEAYLLTKQEPEFRMHAEALRELQYWMCTWEPGMLDCLTRRLDIPQGSLRQARDLKTIFNIEILPFDNPPSSGREIWAAIAGMYLSSPLRELLDEGKLMLSQNRASVDLMIRVTKGDGARHIMGRYQLCSNDALAIGDRHHSDLSMMDECNYAACPSNADEALKEYVLRRGEHGYVSAYPHSKGVLDILGHVAERWL